MAILGNSNTPSALGFVMPLFHWAMPSRYHSIHKNDLARAMVAQSEQAFLALAQGKGPAAPAVKILEYRRWSRSSWRATATRREQEDAAKGLVNAPPTILNTRRRLRHRSSPPFAPFSSCSTPSKLRRRQRHVMASVWKRCSASRFLATAAMPRAKAQAAKGRRARSAMNWAAP